MRACTHTPELALPRYVVDRSPCLRGSFTIVNGLRLHARVSRTPPARGAPTVVLVHGLGVSSAYLVPTAERLAAFAHVHAPDLPGHGKSDTPERALNVPELAEALLRWMDAAALERPALLGNSLGCQTILHLAARHPDRVDRLILTGPTVDVFHRSAAVQTLRLLSGALFERPSLDLIIAQDYLRMGARVLEEAHHALADRPEETATGVRAPALLVRGANDPLTSPRWMTELATRLRAPGFHTIPGWGHAVNYSAPDALVEIVRPFLLDAPRARVSGIP